MKALVFVALWAAGVALAQPSQGRPQVGQVSKDSVWVPTPERMIHRLLQLADTTDKDVVLDLGSGDGRMPIHAAKSFGARGIGIELEPNLIEVARRNAAAQGVSDRVQFIRQDFFETDLSVATVLALYISPGVMEKLKPRFLALKPGTRIASHQFTLGDWEPDETVKTEERMGYLWVVPADLRGEWTIALAEDRFNVRVGQRYQVLTAAGERGGKALPVLAPRVRGTEIRFSSFDADGSSRQFEGRVASDRMSGTSGGEGVATLQWTAERHGR
jgi:SAM-dependent methyltransferase